MRPPGDVTTTLPVRSLPLSVCSTASAISVSRRPSRSSRVAIRRTRPTTTRCDARRGSIDARTGDARTGWQDDRERRPAPHLAPHPHGPAVHLDEGLHDAQPEPEPAAVVLEHARGVPRDVEGGEERLEDAGQAR